MDAQAEQDVAVRAGAEPELVAVPPAGEGGSAGDSRNAARTSASTAQAWRSHRGGTTSGCRPGRARSRRPAAAARIASRSRAVAASPPSCTAVPERVAEELRRRARRPSAPTPARRSARPSASRTHARRPSRARRSPPSGRGSGRRAARSARASSGTRRARGRSTQPAVQPADVRTGVGVVLDGTRTPLRMSSRCRTVAPAYPRGRRAPGRARRPGGRSSSRPRSEQDRRRRTRRPTWSPTAPHGPGRRRRPGRRPPRRARRPGARRRRRCRSRPGPSATVLASRRTRRDRDRPARRAGSHGTAPAAPAGAVSRGTPLAIGQLRPGVEQDGES